MASNMASTSYLDVDEDYPEYSSLHQMFKIVGDQITETDLRTLKLLTYSIVRDDIVLRAKDGFTFLLALEKIGKVDQTNFHFLAEIISQHTDRHDLLHFLSLKRRKTVTSDPVSKYLEETCKRGCQRKRKNSDASPSSENVPSSSSCQDPLSSTSSSSEGSCRDSNMCSSCTSSLGSARSERHAKQSRRDGSGTSVVTAKVCHSLQVHGKTEWKANESKPEEKNGEIKKKMTCDIRLRVRAEYSQSEESLESSVHSDKEEALERQFERFTQANTILKSRDLGSIICDIKFSELTYLDAFWRDYVNGSLLEALKGVFITDSLKQAVGHETIKLMVNVDEDDYEIGRLKLLQNLMD